MVCTEVVTVSLSLADVILTDTFIGYLVGNTLWLIAVGYYIYVTFLGYSGEYLLFLADRKHNRQVVHSNSLMLWSTCGHCPQVHYVNSALLHNYITQVSLSLFFK